MLNVFNTVLLAKYTRTSFVIRLPKTLPSMYNDVSEVLIANALAPLFLTLLYEIFKQIRVGLTESSVAPSSVISLKLTFSDLISGCSFRKMMIWEIS